MPRYSAQNLAALNPEYRKANNISLGGNSGKKSRYAYGKQNNIFIASGKELNENGLCYRLLPIYESPGHLASFREGNDGAAFGDWARLVTCAHWVGNPGLCFIVHDGNPEINLYQSPLHVLRKAAWDSKDTPGIGRLFSELLSNQFTRNSHVGSLKKPEETLFISASAVYVNDRGEITLGAFTDDRDRNARIIGLKKTAAQSLLAAAAVRDESTGEFLVRDMLTMEAAPLVTFLPNGYTSGGHNLIGQSVNGAATFQCPKYVRSANKSAQFVVGYPQSRTDVTHFAIIHDTYMDHEISLDAYADAIAAETKTWDDYLFVPTYEEQAEMIAPVFPREALEYAWQDHPEYLQAIPKNTVTVSMLDDEEDVAPAPAPRAAAPQPAFKKAAPAKPKAADPVTPWDDDPVAAGEISAEEAAGVSDMFSVPADAPAPAPAAPAAAGKLNANDILARAKARLAANKK
jgi:hypothetical protein